MYEGPLIDHSEMYFHLKSNSGLHLRGLLLDILLKLVGVGPTFNKHHLLK